MWKNCSEDCSVYSIIYLSLLFLRIPRSRLPLPKIAANFCTCGSLLTQRGATNPKRNLYLLLLLLTFFPKKTGSYFLDRTGWARPARLVPEDIPTTRPDLNLRNWLNKRWRSIWVNGTTGSSQEAVTSANRSTWPFFVFPDDLFSKRSWKQNQLTSEKLEVRFRETSLVWIQWLNLVDFLSNFLKKVKCIHSNPAISSRCPVTFSNAEYK